MTAREYFKQAYRLDHLIDSRIKELSRLRQLVSSLSSPTLTGKVQTSQANQATFVRSIEKIIDLENCINRDIDAFVDLKKEINRVIDAIPDKNESAVLCYRYIHGYTHESIAKILGASERSVKRWHNDGLAHAVIPVENT